mmetsp:Transcript_28480/g.48449  ORF Transcript_28480/g.48449 Transcript_28480/m.48449 type:complete len:85 (+) Transcript_28480:433-687(+)
MRSARVETRPVGEVSSDRISEKVDVTSCRVMGRSSLALALAGSGSSEVVVGASSSRVRREDWVMKVRREDEDDGVDVAESAVVV